jgi:hypothetical protein
MNREGWDEYRYDVATVAPEMALIDIRDMMEWESDLPFGDDDDQQWSDSVWGRWQKTPLEKRLEVQAKFAYMWADAMIAAGGKSPKKR